MITSNFRIVAIVGSVALFVAVIELVRRRRIKEEYTVLWVAIAIVFVLLSVWGGLLKGITDAIGAKSQSSTLYFFGILFIILVLLHFSLRVSSLERRVVALLQEVALLSASTGKSAANGVPEVHDGHSAVGVPEPVTAEHRNGVSDDAHGKTGAVGDAGP